MNRAALVFVASVLAGSAAALGEEAKTPLVWLSLPGKTWAFVVRTPGFTLEENALGMNRNGRPERRAVATNGNTGVVLSAYVWKEGGRADAHAGRDREWPEERKAKMPIVGFKPFERDGSAGVQYFLPDFAGLELKQKHVHSYWAKDDCLIEVHLSKRKASEADAHLFSEILSSAEFTIGSDPETVFHVQQGTRALKAGDRKTLIGEFEAALAVERKGRTLERAIWRMVVDELGMSYGIAGDVERCREILRYGVREDPDYPMFHYNLACAAGEMGELDTVLSELRIALKNKANLDPGDEMPDPRKDDSFKRFWADSRFRALLVEFGVK